jgi:hypothetical protein
MAGEQQMFSKHLGDIAGADKADTHHLLPLHEE